MCIGTKCTLSEIFIHLLVHSVINQLINCHGHISTSSLGHIIAIKPATVLLVQKENNLIKRATWTCLVGYS